MDGVANLNEAMMKLGDSTVFFRKPELFKMDEFPEKTKTLTGVPGGGDTAFL